MIFEYSRRTFIAALGAIIGGCDSKARQLSDPTGAVAELEHRIGGRLGVYAIATDDGTWLSYRGGERFAMCSTFKWLLAAAVLTKVDQGELTLAQEIEFGAADLLDYAPVVRGNLQRARMTIHELADAAVTVSDNTAANLLLDRVGGPSGLTQFLREHSDPITRLDRNEPSLNANEPGDPRDTTSPQAMVSTMRALLTTSALKPASRALLLDWMIASKTGSERLRAGFPMTWRAGDKTGTGNHGAVNDVAIAWPPKRAPLLLAVYMSGSPSPQSTLVAAHAELGRFVASRLSGAPTHAG